MILQKNAKDCCGCTACASICNHDAITMNPDDLGFLYPEIDVTKCVECGLCEKICSFNAKYDTSRNLSVPIAYGARHKDLGQVMQSRSGATFVAVSDYVISKGGVVYGVGYKQHFKVAHKRATNAIERDEFRGSKYVQSDLSDIFRSVKTDLRNGLLVLFVGTGCQTSALNSFVGKKYRDNLILMDIICHGVLSPKYWSDYVNYLERVHGDNLKTVNFRDKTKYGWAAHHESFEFEDGSKIYPPVSFYNNIAFRVSCSNCHFCNTRRPSDITIGDFWGWEKQSPTANVDDKGLSLVLINTPYGKEIWNEVKCQMDFFNAEPKAYLQPNLLSPTAVHPKHNRFKADYIGKGFEYVLKKDYNRVKLHKRVLNKLFRIFRSYL